MCQIRIVQARLNGAIESGQVGEELSLTRCIQATIGLDL